MVKRTAKSSLLALVSIFPGSAAAQVRKAPQTAEIGRIIVRVRNPDVPLDILSLSQAVADRIFTGVGIKIDWRSGAARSREQPITIDLAVAPPHSQPHVLAYALPYEGVHIHVFYDRIQEEPNRAAVLAHVFVHEITHMLQGVVRHSETGIMKARWTAADIDQMGFSTTLPFTAADVMLIRLGVARRAEALKGPVVETPADEIADSEELPL